MRRTQGGVFLFHNRDQSIFERIYLCASTGRQEGLGGIVFLKLWGMESIQTNRRSTDVDYVTGQASVDFPDQRKQFIENRIRLRVSNRCSNQKIVPRGSCPSLVEVDMHCQWFLIRMKQLYRVFMVS